jgi:tetratricopeptide (TPR) repeat protein
VAADFQILSEDRIRFWLTMRLRRPVPVVALTIFLCATHFGLASSKQNHTNERDEIILRIQQLIEDHSLAEASHQIVEAEKQYPQDAGFDNLRGIVKAQQGDYAAAEESFGHALKREPRFTAASLNLGRLLQENFAADAQTKRKALDVYLAVLKYDPKNAEANYQSALLLLGQGRYRDSLDHISRLPEESQTSAQELSILCADYAGLGDRKSTDTAATRLLLDPNFSELDAQQVLLGLRAGKRDDQIISLLENLQKRQPLSPALLGALGLAYEGTGKLREARDTLERAATPETLTVGTLLQLARVARKQRDYQGSLGYLAHARDLAPNNSGIHYYFGLVCLDLNLIAEARNSFEKAVQIEPENPDYNYAMGATSTFRHDPGEAVPYFEKYLKLRPQEARGKLALGTALFRAKDYEAAVPRLKEAAMIRETATTAHYYLGAIALRERRLEESRNELELALKNKPDYADALAELGEYYLMQKNYTQAEKYIRRALEIEPDHYSANFYLLTLYTRTGDARQEAQSKRFDELKNLLSEKMQEFLRIVEVRPIENQ